jgi:hypothetical protein
MSKTEPNRIRWIPRTDEDCQVVREALERVLASPNFCNSKRYPTLLRYVVEQMLEGNDDQIKERTVGVEVFGRQPDYDTNSDTVVRYTAGEVRKRLSLYYHDAPHEPIHISLSPRSYLPEFYQMTEGQPVHPTGEHVETHPFHDNSDAPQIRQALLRRFLIWNACLLLVVVMIAGAIWGWREHRTQAIRRFWSPIMQAQGPVVISTGGVLSASVSDPNAHYVDLPARNAYLSFQNGLAMGRVAAHLTASDVSYRIESSSETTMDQIRQSPVVLIGAYNNDWTLRLLEPLRFHFNSVHSDEAILDRFHPEKRWVRDSTKPFTDSPDYAIVARFRDPSSDSVVIVAAGLQRFGTDAASLFIVSSRLLQELNQQIGWNWTDKNIEVVLRVDVVNGKNGAPIIEATHVW